MRRWRHRRHEAGLDNAPLTPAQVHTLRDQDGVLVTWATRGFIVAAMITVLVVGATAANFNASAYMTLVVLGFGTSIIFVIALIASGRGFVKPAGLLVWGISTLAIVVVCYELSAGAEAQSMLFGLAIMPFVLVTAKETALRMVMSGISLLAYPLCIVAWRPGQGSHQLTASMTADLATFNAIGGVILAGGALAVLQFRLQFNRRIFEGAARYGELRATTDELTGVYNRRPVIAQLEQYAERGRANYAIALIDLDEFKDINDEFGHDCGDAMIKLVADTLTGHFRATDMVSRWGGDEFLVLMPGIRHGELDAVLERLRASIAALRLDCDGHRHHVTVSIGASMGHLDQSADECIAAADHALYRAKENGRNDVVTVGAAMPTGALGRS